MNKTKRILKFLLKDMVEVRLSLPGIIFVLILLLPLVAYGDVVMFGHRDFMGYLGVCFLEIVLVYCGILIGGAKIKR